MACCPELTYRVGWPSGPVMEVLPTRYHRCEYVVDRNLLIQAAEAEADLRCPEPPEPTKRREGMRWRSSVAAQAERDRWRDAWTAAYMAAMARLARFAMDHGAL